MDNPIALDAAAKVIATMMNWGRVSISEIDGQPCPCFHMGGDDNTVPLDTDTVEDLTAMVQRESGALHHHPLTQAIAQAVTNNGNRLGFDAIIQLASVHGRDLLPHVDLWKH